MANLSFLRRIRDGWFSVDFWLCTTLMFLVEFGCAVLGAPSPKLLEMVVCEDYYRNNTDTPTQGDCKVQEVQVKLGFLLTLLSTFSVLAGRSPNPRDYRAMVVAKSAQRPSCRFQWAFSQTKGVERQP